VDEDRKEELRRQFGTVWKMASSGLDTLREVVVRSSQSGRLRVDLALLSREKQQLLEALGAQVAQLIEARKLEVPSAVRDTYERLRELEERLRVDAVKVHDNAFGATRGYEAEASPYRRRGRRRPRRARRGRGAAAPASPQVARRPTAPEAASARR
jgi:hypothetical protein